MASLSYHLKRNSKNPRPQSTNSNSTHTRNCDTSFSSNLYDISVLSRYPKQAESCSSTPFSQFKTIFIQDTSTICRPLSTGTHRSYNSHHIPLTSNSQISSESMLNQFKTHKSDLSYIESTKISKGIIMLDRPKSSRTPRFNSKPRKKVLNEYSDSFEKSFEYYITGLRSNSRPRSSYSSVPKRASQHIKIPREVLDSQQVQELIHIRPKVKEEHIEIDPIKLCYE